MKQYFQGMALFFSIFALVGTLFGAISLGMLWHDFRIMQSGKKTAGKVIEMRQSHDGNSAPVIEYHVRDSMRLYFSDTYSSPPVYKIGQKVSIWYDAQDPEKVVLSGFDQWFLPVFFGFFFLVFGGIGYGGLLFQYVRNLERKRLVRTGKAVEAVVYETFFNGSINVNGQCPWIVRCKWTDPLNAQSYTFDSENLWNDPNPSCPRGSKLTVYIEPDNPLKYYMDVSFLKNK